MHIQISSLLRTKFFIQPRTGVFAIPRLFISVLPPASTYKMSNFEEKEMNKLLQKANIESRKAKSAYYSPSHVTLQVLGNGAPGSPKSVFLSSNHTKFLFNCGEGTQRLAHEHHMRLTKLEHVLFTTPTWENMGGLPGMALTIQDCGVPELNLHGPRGIYDIFEAVKKFVNLTHLKVQESECDENTVYQDNCLNIRYVHLTKPTVDTDSDSDDPLLADNTNYYSHESPQSSKPPSPQTNIDPALLRKITGCLAYICKLTDKEGALNLGACVDKGVKPGPLLGQLKSGHDVTLEDGTVIKSVDVCDPPSIGPTFVILECPDEDYLDSLLAHSGFRNCQAHSDHPAMVVVHFSRDRIIKHPRYLEWMKRFPASTTHLVVNECNGGIVHESCRHMQNQLNLVHPTIFPHLHSVQPPEDKAEEDGLKIIQAKTLNTMHLRPMDGFDDSTVVSTSMDDLLAELHDKESFEETLAELQKEIKSHSQLIERSDKFPKILMLGTGSSIPGKVRNTSCIILRVDENTNIIMDCGEGTYGQICRFFGPETNEFLRNVKAIYLSHLHADHHLGLLGLLQMRRNLTNQPVYLIAPKQIDYWLQLYHRKFEKINDCYNLIPNQDLMLGGRKIQSEVDHELKTQLGIRTVQTVYVRHCVHSFGVAWTLENGRKIVYSGDTMPCDALVLLGRNCDLLIHEATMEDSLQREAVMKMHSTVAQAIEIGEKMNAKFTFLTHFSQRYSKLPFLADNVDYKAKNIGIAFDNMQFNFAQLCLLPLFYPTLKIMFSDFQEILEARAAKRAKRIKVIQQI